MKVKAEDRNWTMRVYNIQLEVDSGNTEFALATRNSENYYLREMVSKRKQKMTDGKSGMSIIFKNLDEIDEENCEWSAASFEGVIKDDSIIRHVVPLKNPKFYLEKGQKYEFPVLIVEEVDEEYLIYTVNYELEGI